MEDYYNGRGENAFSAQQINESKTYQDQVFIVCHVLSDRQQSLMLLLSK